MNDMARLGAPVLSVDELDCLRRLAEGCEPALIAKDLGRSEAEIDGLLDRAAEGLGARTRLQAVVRAMRLDLFATTAIPRSQ